MVWHGEFTATIQAISSQSIPLLTASPLWKRSPIGTLTPLATTALSGEVAPKEGYHRLMNLLASWRK